VGGYVINMGQIRREPRSGPALLSVVLAFANAQIGGAVQYPPASPTPLAPARGEAATLAAISLRRSFDAAL
jgi:hypothetical protein